MTPEVLLRFTIPGAPTAKGRARHARVGKFVRTYTPEKTRRYEDTVRLFASEAMAGRTPLDQPLAMRVVFHMTMPSSWSKKRRAEALDGQIQPTKKPDLSNMLKAVEDACNAIVYTDDSRVVSLTMDKRYAQNPRAEVTFYSHHGRNAP